MSRDSRLMLMLGLILTAAAGRTLMGTAGEGVAPARLPLTRLPASIDGWVATEDRAMTPGESRELGADDYLARSYTSDDGSSAYLFIAYYANQRHRRTIHSPRNCLPGSGWTIGEHRIHRIDGGSANEYAIAKDGAEMLAFYWYQGRGRIEHGDLAARLHTIQDALTSGRTDGAVVRVVIPLSRGPAGRDQARSAALSLIASLLRRLDDYIPR